MQVDWLAEKMRELFREQRRSPATQDRRLVTLVAVVGPGRDVPGQPVPLAVLAGHRCQASS